VWDAGDVREATQRAATRAFAGVGCLSVASVPLIGLWVLAGIASLSLPSCDLHVSSSPVGVVASDDGVTLVLGPCFESVSSVSVSGGVGADRLLWALEADPPVATTSVAVGTVPPGFRATSLEIPDVLPDEASVLVLGSGGGTSRVGLFAFETSDLQPDSILTATGPVDLATFADLPCPATN
jgi:hypothetical protein